jgi:uncharacterized lipoprotein YajG
LKRLKTISQIMNPIRIQSIFIALSISLVILAGCSRASSTTLAPEKIPTAMNDAFKNAPGDTKTMAGECATACQNQDVTAAFAGLQKLSNSKDLTPEQRAVTAKAMASTFRRLQVNAENGNAAAQALVQKYMSTR